MIDAIFQVLGALGLAAEIATAEPTEERQGPRESGGVARDASDSGDPGVSTGTPPAVVIRIEPAAPVSQGGSSAAPAYQAPLAAENQSDWQGGSDASDPTEAERADTLPLNLEREPELAR